MFIRRYIAHIQKINSFKTFIIMLWVAKFSYKELMGVCLKQGVQPWADRLLYNPSPKKTPFFLPVPFFLRTKKLMVQKKEASFLI